jgi:hypothetical protein
MRKPVLQKIANSCNAFNKILEHYFSVKNTPNVVFEPVPGLKSAAFDH